MIKQNDAMCICTAKRLWWGQINWTIIRSMQFSGWLYAGMCFFLHSNYRYKSFFSAHSLSRLLRFNATYDKFSHILTSLTKFNNPVDQILTNSFTWFDLPDRSQFNNDRTVAAVMVSFINSTACIRFIFAAQKEKTHFREERRRTETCTIHWCKIYLFSLKRRWIFRLHHFVFVYRYLFLIFQAF